MLLRVLDGNLWFRMREGGHCTVTIGGVAGDSDGGSSVGSSVGSVGMAVGCC
jgi:hypothetical protein